MSLKEKRLLNKCQKWHENNEFQKIVDALETIPASEHTPEIDCELARAYNNLGGMAEPTNRELLKRAIDLLRPHEEHFRDNHNWNYRMGYAYACLDQEGIALQYFRKALEARPGDESTKEFIEMCEDYISVPHFSENFRQRTETAWKTFSEQEAELRRIMGEDTGYSRAAEITDRAMKILEIVFDEGAVLEMGFNGGKYELILSPKGNNVRLFEMVYFRNHAPKEVLENWSILVGRQPAGNEIAMRTESGSELAAKDVQIWLDKKENGGFFLEVYSDILLSVFRKDEDRAWWMLDILVDHTLGEIPYMKYIDGFSLLQKPKTEPCVLLSQLPEKMKEMGADLSEDPGAFLEGYQGYSMEPVDDPDADWRMDVIAGSSKCMDLISGYYEADNYYMDMLHADGAVAAFVIYPLDSLREDESTQKIFDFRDQLEGALTDEDGSDVLTVIGGASGLYCGYLDFIAWDIIAALDKMKAFFDKTDIPWATVQTFRREARAVRLK